VEVLEVKIPAGGPRKMGMDVKVREILHVEESLFRFRPGMIASSLGVCEIWGQYAGMSFSSIWEPSQYNMGIVIPAKAGIRNSNERLARQARGIPAFAGMTPRGAVG